MLKYILPRRLPLVMAAVALSGAMLPAQADTLKILYANSATFGPDLVDKYDISTGSGALLQTYAIASTPAPANGRGVVVVGDTMYTTQSSDGGNPNGQFGFNGDNHIYMTSVATGLPTGTITVGALPAGHALSTLAWDGSHFWAAEYLGSNLAYEIDTAGNIVKTITLANAHNNMDGLEYFNGKLIANEDDGGGTYDVYDLNGALLQAAFIVAGQGFTSTGIAYDGANFLVSRFSSIDEFDGITGAFIKNIPLTGGSQVIEDLSVDYAQRVDTGHVPDSGSTLTLLAMACAFGTVIRQRLKK